MEDEGREEVSSPLATVEQIQKRLVRPISSLKSQSFTSIITPREDMNSTELRIIKREGAKRQVTNRRLEDYLDPVLLTAIRRKISGKRKGEGDLKLKRETEFVWPIDELKVFGEGLGRAVDLCDDRDSIGGGGAGEEDEEQVLCSPFQQFERVSLKRFKGGLG